MSEVAAPAPPPTDTPGQLRNLADKLIHIPGMLTTADYLFVAADNVEVESMPPTMAILMHAAEVRRPDRDD